MTIAEKVELALILVAALVAVLAAPLLPPQLELGSLLLVGFVLLPAQSLLRDVWLLIQQRRAAAPAQPAQCVCAESIVGAAGVLAGLLVLGAGLGHPVAMTPRGWALCVVVAALAGFLLKDLVFGWNPWSIRREKNHPNIIVRWRI